MTASRGAATDWPRITLAYASDSRKDRNQVIQNDFMFHAVGAGCCRHFGAGYTFLDFGGAGAKQLVDAAAIRRVPMKVFTPDDADRAGLEALYRARAALVRSDHAAD